MCKKTAALLLALLMCAGCCCALAQNTKHERVYAVMTADGTLRSLTDSIRLENADGLEEIADRSRLTGIQNMSGDETFSADGEVLLWQARGRDITYQGTSDMPLPVIPQVRLLLDGEEISFAELQEKSGRAELTVTYSQPEAVPHLAATVLLLPEEGVRSLSLDNASLLSMSTRRAVIGWGVPGADASLNLPSSFTVRFDADHAKLGWMMTFASADPIDLACRELDSRLSLDLRAELDEAASALSALQSGEALPQGNGAAKELYLKINELNGGLTALNDGARQLSDGAAALDAGLGTLSENSAALNQGADAIFAAILGAANEQIRSSGLSEAGLSLPELTPENYQSVLSGTIAQLDLVGALSPKAKEGSQRLGSLLEQLTQVDTFVSGVRAYTGGVDQASAGAGELARGAAKLHDEGTDVLASGILDAEKAAAQQLLPWVEGNLSEAVRVFEETGARVRGCGYDLRPEDMKAVTLFVIRTDL